MIGRIDRKSNTSFSARFPCTFPDAEIITELILTGKANAIVAEKMQLAQSANHLFAQYFPQPHNPGHPLSFYRWLPLMDKAYTANMESYFLNKGIRVFHSDRFLSGANTRNHYLRIALSSTNSLEELKRGLEILKENLGRAGKKNKA
ncbi:hypothetical protein [Paenibacillus mesophilus]|uniref:hypothetical protein n=1 Tax=Paenibacillus mesophilus TaxID=2582849 RepID=UPI001391B126|nr:hypothetical protein [Paenibacillus mesophilus]